MQVVGQTQKIKSGCSTSRRLAGHGWMDGIDRGLTVRMLKKMDLVSQASRLDPVLV